MGSAAAGSTAIAPLSGALAPFGDAGFVGFITLIGTIASVIGAGIALGPIVNPPAAG